jgi:putative RecB family exonuclease
MEQPSRTISISQVQAYLACPLKYRFQYVEKLPRPFHPAALAFGSSVHAALEWFHRERMEHRTPDLAAVLQLFDEDWQAQSREALVFADRESPASLVQKGRDMLRLYISEAAGAAMPVAVEDPFEVSLKDPETGEPFEVTLRGIVDLIEEDGTLVDLKTAGRSFDSLSLERHLQLSAYALAFLLQYGAIPPLRLDVLLKTTKPRLDRLPTTRSLAELSWAAQLIREVSEAIQTEHFFPNPSWRCGDCEYFAQCQGWRGEEPQRLVQLQMEGVSASP